MVKKGLGIIEKNKRFSDLTSMQAGGRIKTLIYPLDANSAIKIIKYLRNKKKHFLVLGNGTNFVASERTYKGVVLSFKKMKESIIEFDSEIECSSNYSVSKLALKMAEKGYHQYAFLSGISGTIGGAVVMNAGCYNMQISDLFLRCSIIDSLGRIRTIYLDDLAFSYRKSTILETGSIILSVTLKKGEKGYYAMNKIREWKEKRKDTQPLNLPNSGSVFKNGNNVPSYKLIDNVGLRGYQIGGAMFSNKHCNFIVNTGKATGEDVLKLVNLAKERVMQKCKVELETEIIFFNFKKL